MGTRASHILALGIAVAWRRRLLILLPLVLAPMLAVGLARIASAPDGVAGHADRIGPGRAAPDPALADGPAGADTGARLAGVRRRMDAASAELAGVEAALQDQHQRLAGRDARTDRVDEAIARLSAELAALRLRYTDAHSQVQAVLRQLARLEEERRQLPASGPEGQGVDPDRLLARAAAGQAPALPPPVVSQLQRLRDLEARRAMLRAELEFLGQTRAEQGLVLAPPVARPALAPRGMPVAALGAGLLAGLALGGALAAAAELMDRRLRRTADVARTFGAPVIARMAHLDPPHRLTR